LLPKEAKMNTQQIVKTYIHIINYLRSKKHATYDDFKKMLGYDPDKNIFTRRNFQRYIKDIEDIFSIKIVCQNREYFIDKDNIKPFISNDLMHRLNIYAACDDFVMGESSAYILPQERCIQGIEYIFVCIEAIKNSKVLKFAYVKHVDRPDTIREVEPYAIKESQNRWYLLAKERDESGTHYKVFGLDRMQEVEITDIPFEKDVSFNPKEYFRDAYGINTHCESGKPEKVVLALGEIKGRFILSNPIHHSQQPKLQDIEVSKQPFNGEVSLYLYPSHDFIMEILSHGKDVRVISPPWLVNRVRETLKEALAQY
jgi:predicted DNA-binding transcriptional regulator YafY